MPINFEIVLPMPGPDRNWDHENKTLSRSEPGPEPKNKTLPGPGPNNKTLPGPGRDQMKLYGTGTGPGPKNKTLPGPEPGPGLKKLGPAHLYS